MKVTQIICIDESYWKCVWRYGADISCGVAELHAAGVSCMNLKPSNLILDARGRAVFSYLGLPEILQKPQCRISRSTLEDDVTRTHSCVECTMLNPHYTAPEAWEPLKNYSLNIFGMKEMEFLQNLMPRVLVAPWLRCALEKFPKLYCVYLCVCSWEF